MTCHSEQSFSDGALWAAGRAGEEKGRGRGAVNPRLGRCEKIIGNQNSLTQGRKVAKQTKEFLLSDLSALAPLRDGFSFFHSF